MRYLIFILPFLLLLLLLPSVSAAQLILSGKVTERNGDPLPGVNVWLKDSFDGSGTDAEGRFRFTADTSGIDSLVLVATALGYQRLELPLSENKGTYLRTGDGRRHLIDFTLDQLEGMLDPDGFFRINRQYIARYEAVDKMLSYSNSRLRLTLKAWPDEDIVLSREKTREFKEWLDR